MSYNSIYQCKDPLNALRFIGRNGHYRNFAEFFGLNKNLNKFTIVYTCRENLILHK